MVRCQEPTYCSTICRARGFSRRLAHEESPRKRTKAGKKEIGKDASYRGRVFPTSAITILALCMAVHSFTFVSLFPYVGIMTCQLLGLDSTNEAGFYAGYVASAFTLGRFLTGYCWGCVSDAIGRKPVIVVGLSATALLSLSFGLSTSYTIAISSRFILGMMNGITPALRTTVHEVCGGSEHGVQAMAYIDGSRAVTIVFGSAIGGLLVQPAEHYPSLFSASGLFGRFPFLIPNLIGAGSALLVLLVVILYLPETKNLEPVALSDNTNGDEYGTFKAETEHGGENAAKTITGKSSALGADKQELALGARATVGVLSVPKVKIILFLVCAVQSLLTGFEEVYPLWALATVANGGLGWSTMQIGKVLFATGLIMAPLQLFVVPPLVKRLGAVTWMRIGCLLGVSTFLATPNARFFSWNYGSLFAMTVASTTMINCCLAAISIALAVASTSVVPSSKRGKLSGLYNTAESLGRFTSATGFAVLFAWSISSASFGWVDHHFVFYASALVMGVVTVLAWRTLTVDVFDELPGQNAGPAEADGGYVKDDGIGAHV